MIILSNMNDMYEIYGKEMFSDYTVYTNSSTCITLICAVFTHCDNNYHKKTAFGFRFDPKKLILDEKKKVLYW